MTNRHTQTKAADRARLPLDLRQSLGDRQLVEFALKAVQELEWSDPDLLKNKNDQFRPQMMMTLLTYCYAAGLYGSEDVQWATQHDPTVRYICARTYPEWKDVRRFRRRNRDAIRKCLGILLRQAWNWNSGKQQKQPDPYYFFRLNSMVEEQIEISARARVEAAAAMDRLCPDH